jgi:hypothetical protein
VAVFPVRGTLFHEPCPKMGSGGTQGDALKHVFHSLDLEKKGSKQKKSEKKWKKNRRPKGKYKNLKKIGFDSGSRIKILYSFLTFFFLNFL